MTMTPDELRLKVFERSNIKLSADDPVFVIVALNDILLEDTTASIKALADTLEAQARALREGVGAIDELVVAKTETLVNEKLDAALAARLQEVEKIAITRINKAAAAGAAAIKEATTQSLRDTQGVSKRFEAATDRIKNPVLSMFWYCMLAGTMGTGLSTLMLKFFGLLK